MPMAPFATEGKTAHPTDFSKNFVIDGSARLKTAIASSAFFTASAESSALTSAGKERTASSGSATASREWFMHPF